MAALPTPAVRAIRSMDSSVSGTPVVQEPPTASKIAWSTASERGRPRRGAGAGSPHPPPPRGVAVRPPAPDGGAPVGVGVRVLAVLERHVRSASRPGAAGYRRADSPARRRGPIPRPGGVALRAAAGSARARVRRGAARQEGGDDRRADQGDRGRGDRRDVHGVQEGLVRGGHQVPARRAELLGDREGALDGLARQGPQRRRHPPGVPRSRPGTWRRAPSRGRPRRARRRPAGRCC